MKHDVINEFAAKLIEHVRDAAIKSCDNILKSDTSIAKRWKEAIEGNEPNNLLKVLIPDCVDETLFCFLQSLDQEVLDLTFKSDNGEEINLINEGMGELSGYYMGYEGWRHQFSKERFNDDFSDLDLDDLDI